MMGTVYVMEQGSVVSKSGGLLVVSKNGQTLAEVPLREVEELQVWGSGITVTTPALDTLTAQGVRVNYFTLGGRRRISVEGPLHKHGELRLKQARLLDRPEWLLGVARRIVAGKVANQGALLEQLQGRAPEPISQALAGVQAMARRVETAANLDSLRGIEGQAAVSYWRGFRALLGREWGFEKRAYRPPTDPINCCLSLGYTRLLTQIQGAVEATGLDPYLGSFHTVDWGRASLALDLEEEWRPVIVDALVLM
ncbi:MAG: CRISPR-associated endonuclease Cas1, partial [Ardenticatenaceae bacterium]